MDEIINNNKFEKIIVQGDTTTAYAIALSAFHFNIKLIHVEAGLRTGNKYSPFPEEMNRKMISILTDIHLCPTQNSVENLQTENITTNVFNVGNTIVDIYKIINATTTPNDNIISIIKNNPIYYIVTLHRRENRENNLKIIWDQLNTLSNNYKFIYITHPSLPESKQCLNSNNIILLEPQNYINMVHLISNSAGIITDSGGLQEEAVCANKKVLICRDTTERPETIDCGLGMLVNTNVIDNMFFLNETTNAVKINPYGENVCVKIMDNIII